MYRIIFFVIFLLSNTLAANSHSGHKHQDTKISAFASSMDSKFAINSDAGHLGHFYLRKVKVKKNKEKLFITQTFHFEEDYTKKTQASYDIATGLLKYNFKIPDRNEEYYFFINLDNFDGTDNDGHRIIVNTEDGSSSSEAINLNVITEHEH